MRALFVIPTTGGPVVIRRILPRDLPLSLAVADGDYRPLPVSEDYGRLVAADGPLAALLGPAAGGTFELRLDRAFETGRSWEFPVALAHAAIAAGWELVDAPEAAERVVIATGALDRDLRLVPADYALTVKVERLADLVGAALKGAARVAAFIPAGDPGVELAQSRLRALTDGGDHATPIVVSLAEALAALRLAPAASQPAPVAPPKPALDPKPETAAVKRKIAAILAADVYGYSRMMAEDEEGVLRRLAAARAVFDEFVKKSGGRIFNTAGDSVMCEFESAVEAVRCAVDIQEALRTRALDIEPSKRLVFRIGISIGDVVERNGDLLGDGVNVAARLESIAEPGGIVVSRSVHEAVGNKVAVMFQDLGAREVKNLSPVHAFAVATPATRIAAAEEAARTAIAAAQAATLTVSAPMKPAAPAPAIAETRRRPLPVPAIAAGVAALLAVGAGGFFMLGRPAQPPATVTAAAPPAASPASPAPEAPRTAAAVAPVTAPPSPAAPAPVVATPMTPPSAPPAVTAAVPTTIAPPQRAPEPAALPIVLEELRAAPGRSCADLVFGGVQPTRQPVAVREDGSPAPSHPSGLCGLAFRVSAGGERLGFKLDPAVTAAGIVSNTQAGAGAGELSTATVMFRQNAKLPTRHVIEIVDRRADPPAVRRLVHEIGAGATAAPSPNRMAQPADAPAIR